MSASNAELGNAGKLKLFDDLNEIRDLGEIDPDTFNIVRRVIFGSDGENQPPLPEITAYAAGVLLEVMKDLLYQSYVRKGRLQQAMSTGQLPKCVSSIVSLPSPVISPITA